jgi:hypothetical protein
LAGIEPVDPLQWKGLGRTLATLPGYQPGPALSAEESAAVGAQADLAETCAGTPLRHKISSSFALPQFDLPAVQNLTSVTRKTDARPDAPVCESALPWRRHRQ